MQQFRNRKINKKSVEHKELQKEGTSHISTGNTKGTALIDVYPESEKAFAEFEDLKKHSTCTGAIKKVTNMRCGVSFYKN